MGHEPSPTYRPVLQSAPCPHLSHYFNTYSLEIIVREHALLSWFEQHCRPFLARHVPERVSALENDYNRLHRLLSSSENVIVCFLGNSGIGKSTLLNALAAGADQVLPAGGIGPLTAQATEVHYSPTPSFKVRYHPKKRLWEEVFALESQIAKEHRAKSAEPSSSPHTLHSGIADVEQELDDDTKRAILFEINPGETDPSAPTHDAMEVRIKQARQIVTGDQFSDKPLTYLADALRLASDNKPRWNSEINKADLARIDRVKQALQFTKNKRVYERIQGGDIQAFMEDMKAHAAGFLSPLIEQIEVGWPSDVLQSGVTLVDLPGVGIAQDSYRDITKQYVREKARAVILVVDRAGPTEATIELLRSSGYWDRIVGAADDPDSDPCSILIAVTKVDDVASENWRNLPLSGDGKKLKKREVFTNLVEEFKPRMRAQIQEQLLKIGTSDNDSVQTAREQARKNILDTLEIHPVSAPELRKLLLDDEEDRAFLQTAEQTGVPALQESLVHLAHNVRETRNQRIEAVYQRFSNSIVNELSIIKGQWQERTRAAEEAEKLAAALETILDPKRKEYERRLGAFREFLDQTVQTKIELLVAEARTAAESEVNKYLLALRNYHWATLRAAVRRGGCFYGGRSINLPNDIADYFQEPMAAVWGQRLLKDIRKRTSELSSDIAALVEEICIWATENGGAHVNAQLLDNQKIRIQGLAEQMRQVGKEAVDELRATVKNRLNEAIQKPIRVACEKFVNDGDHIGPGVKFRIIELFSSLAKQATVAAQKPATDILQKNFAQVRKEIASAFEQWGDPIQETADLIVERHEERVRRSDAQKRSRILAEIDEVYRANPLPPLDETPIAA